MFAPRASAQAGHSVRSLAAVGHVEHQAFTRTAVGEEPRTASACAGAGEEYPAMAGVTNTMRIYRA